MLYIYSVSLFFPLEKNRCYEMSSFDEKQATALLKERPIEFVNYNKHQLSRVYPTGTRFDSSNFMPQVGEFYITFNKIFTKHRLHLLTYSSSGMPAVSWWRSIIRLWTWLCNWIWAYSSTMTDRAIYWSQNLWDVPIDVWIRLRRARYVNSMPFLVLAQIYRVTLYRSMAS